MKKTWIHACAASLCNPITSASRIPLGFIPCDDWIFVKALILSRRPAAFSNSILAEALSIFVANISCISVDLPFRKSSAEFTSS